MTWWVFTVLLSHNNSFTFTSLVIVLKISCRGSNTLPASHCQSFVIDGEAYKSDARRKSWSTHQNSKKLHVQDSKCFYWWDYFNYYTALWYGRVLSSVGKNADLGRCWFKKINLHFKREFREWPDVFTVFYSTTHQLQHNLCEWC